MVKVLVVEDNELNREVLGRRLRRQGFNVGFADTGTLAVQIAYHHQPDLILMDMSLPEKDGWTATREIKGFERTREIPIIALTAHAMAEDRQRALEAGCDEFEMKPIEMASLLGKMYRLLGMSEDSPEAVA